MDASPPVLPVPVHVALVRLEPGSAGRIVAVPPDEAERLASEGLHVGDTLVMEARLPLGGPVVVRLGRARVALARRVAGAIVMESAGVGPVGDRA